MQLLILFTQDSCSDKFHSKLLPPHKKMRMRIQDITKVVMPIVHDDSLGYYHELSLS